MLLIITSTDDELLIACSVNVCVIDYIDSSVSKAERVPAVVDKIDLPQRVPISELFFLNIGLKY